MASRSTFRAALPTGTCLFALAVSLQSIAPALAQDTASVEDEGVVVTGSRIASGFRTPTPVTVAPVEDLRASAATNLADGLNQLPVFSGSIKTQNPTTTNQPGATSGQNLLALRGLGANRTLVLLNGSRMPATNSAGSTDVDTLPQGLVSRVEVVTGGASAAYGSDAVSGVVNFVLDTKFQGLKTNLQYGLSTHNDLPSKSATVTFGKGFGDGAFRVVGNLDFFMMGGLSADARTGRNWFDKTNSRVPNPVVGALPSQIFITDARSSVGTYGGLITGCTGATTAACALIRGRQFVDGALVPFDAGTSTGAAFQSGGDGARANIGLIPEQKRGAAFLRSEYDVNNKVTLYGELLYSLSHTWQGAFYNNSSGAANAYTIFAGNPYIPTTLAQTMAANNITQFTLGRFEADLPLVENEDRVDMYHGAAGIEGHINDRWSYDASYTYGTTRQWLSENGLTVNRNLYAAADAVRDPATGQIVCRSTLLFGNDPGCTPRNLFGVQPLNDAITNYVTGVSVQIENLTQKVAQANISGDLGDKLQFGAGPIHVASGLEYRKEEAAQVADAISASTPSFTNVRGTPAALVGRLGGFRTNNPQAMNGAYDIKEGYVEVGAPLLKDLPFAQEVNFNGAVRRAQYSTGAGGVTTWKAGLDYSLNSAVRFRVTRSQDIRGADVIELFNGTTQINNNTTYKGVSTPTQNFMSGNIDLKPETAQTLTYGFVVRPSFLNAFQMSVDYYNIEIKDAIGNIGAQQIIDQCDLGNQALCSLISFTAANTLIIRVPTLNLAVVKNEGVDYEALYSVPVFGDRLSFRLFANQRLADYSQAVGSALQQGLNSPGSPRWRASLQVRYEAQNWTMFVQERYQYHSKIDPTRLAGFDIPFNHVPDVGYTDATFTYKANWMNRAEELYFSVTNLTDQPPAYSPPGVSAFTMAASGAYDPIGRYFNVGLRTKF